MHFEDMDIPSHYFEQIKERIHSQVQLELKGSTDYLYQFILPSIRRKREAERTDEPELTLSAISQFVIKLKSAKLLDVQCAEFHPTSQIYGNSPAAVMEYKIRYNDKLAHYRTIWVLHEKLWYSTGLNKQWF
tara:strand:+ start:130 stop:525 length:396 start_codon:yes stop_codon:yes gene_type:complete